MSRPLRRPFAEYGPALARAAGLLAALLAVAALAYAYVSLAGQISAASERWQQLDARLRVEQARGGELRAEIAELHSVERVVPVGVGRLNLHPPTISALSFVPMPRLAAASTGAATGPTAWAGQSKDSPLGRGSEGMRPRRVLIIARPGPDVVPERNWWEQMVAFLSPGSASASEHDPNQR